MLFLFENTLTPYIYSVFYNLISWEHHATIWATSKLRADTPHRPPHPLPDLCSLAPWSTTPRTTPRAHTDRHTITNDPGNLHAMSNHTQNDTQCEHRPQHHQPPSGGISPVKSRLLIDTGQLLSAVGRAAREWELTKNQFALTVKKLTRFLGFNLRIAVFRKFGFWDIYLEQKNIKTAYF